MFVINAGKRGGISSATEVPFLVWKIILDDGDIAVAPSTIPDDLHILI